MTILPTFHLAAHLSTAQGLISSASHSIRRFLSHLLPIILTQDSGNWRDGWKQPNHYLSLQQEYPYESSLAMQLDVSASTFLHNIIMFQFDVVIFHSILCSALRSATTCDDDWGISGLSASLPRTAIEHLSLPRAASGCPRNPASDTL